MASAEQLLNEAQYAFANITFGESLANMRHAARAKSLCRKIIRKFPATMEASEAHAILRRLGEEAYASELPVRHRHASQSRHHDTRQSQPVSGRAAAGQRAGQDDTLNWAGLVGLLFSMPRVVLFAVVVAGFVLFSLFGWLFVVPLVALVLFTGPFRSLLKPEQRNQVNEFIVRVNGLIEERRNAGRFS